MTRWRLANAAIVAAAALLLTSPGGANVPPRISIIIDDLGYQLEAGRRAIDLPGPLAYAILPGAPRARILAELANEHGKEVLLHLPLEAVESNGRFEPGAIMLDMSHTAFQAAFEAAIQSVPFAVGVSSHRGSLLTRHPGHMGWLMKEILRHDGLFFIDSYTTHESIALRIAAESGVTAIKRDVFLDHNRRPGEVRAQFERLKKLARLRGKAVGIGHPYPETLELLERELPNLAAEGIRLVPVSQLIT
jgi:polysaccharide deacetylase 2 family uncharacterized protein YibQ